MQKPYRNRLLEFEFRGSPAQFGVTAEQFSDELPKDDNSLPDFWIIAPKQNRGTLGFFGDVPRHEWFTSDLDKIRVGVRSRMVYEGGKSSGYNTYGEIRALRLPAGKSRIVLMPVEKFAFEFSQAWSFLFAELHRLGWLEIETYYPFSENLYSRETSSEPFNEEEKRHVKVSLLEFQSLVIEKFEPSPDQTEYIKERIEYLIDAVDRSSKFDWANLALSIVIAIAINLMVDTEGGKLLFALFQQAFESAIKLLTKG